MSYDLEVLVKVYGDGGYARIAQPEYSSPTYNLGEMFRAAMGWDFKQGVEYKCIDIMDNINNGINELKCFPYNYTKYEPENKWGTVESAIRDLESLRDCIYEAAEHIPAEYLYVRW